MALVHGAGRQRAGIPTQVVRQARTAKHGIIWRWARNGLPKRLEVATRTSARGSRYGAGVNANHQLIERFYTAFNAHDTATMAASYRDDATFADPVFPALDAAGVRAMWTMLSGRAADLTVQASHIVIDGDRGTAHWVAR